MKGDCILRETVLRYISGSELAAGMFGDRKTERFCQSMYKFVNSIPPADVVPVEWVPVKERLPEPWFPVWAACKAADGRENWVIETSYIPNPQSKSQWGPVPILETGRATVYAWAERHPPEAPKEG